MKSYEKKLSGRAYVISQSQVYKTVLALNLIFGKGAVSAWVLATIFIINAYTALPSTRKNSLVNKQLESR